MLRFHADLHHRLVSVAPVNLDLQRVVPTDAQQGLRRVALSKLLDLSEHWLWRPSETFSGQHHSNSPVGDAVSIR